LWSCMVLSVLTEDFFPFYAVSRVLYVGLLSVLPNWAQHAAALGISSSGWSVAGSRRSRNSRHACSLPEPGVSVDSIADVQNKLRSRTRNSFAVRHVIKRPLQFGMLVDVRANFLKALSRAL